MNTMQSNKELSTFGKLTCFFNQLATIFKTEPNGIDTQEESRNTPSEDTLPTHSKKISKEGVNVVLDVLPCFVETGIIEYDADLMVYHCGIYAFTPTLYYKILHKNRQRIQVLRYNLNYWCPVYY